MNQHLWKPELRSLGRHSEHDEAFQSDHLPRFVLPLFECRSLRLFRELRPARIDYHRY
jgi:hypothetical protein